MDQVNNLQRNWVHVEDADGGVPQGDVENEKVAYPGGPPAHDEGVHGHNAGGGNWKERNNNFPKVFCVPVCLQTFIPNEPEETGHYEVTAQEKEEVVGSNDPGTAIAKDF